MKKLTAAALAVCMTAGMMTGCSAPEPEETTAPSKAAESVAEAQGEGDAEAVELSGSLTRGTLVSLSNYYEIDAPEEGRLLFASHVDTERFFQILEQYF